MDTLYEILEAYRARNASLLKTFIKKPSHRMLFIVYVSHLNSTKGQTANAPVICAFFMINTKYTDQNLTGKKKLQHSYHNQHFDT